MSCPTKRGILLSIIFVLGTEMKHNLNKKNSNRYTITTAFATIFTLAIMITSIMAAAPAAATTTTTTTTTSPPEEAGMIELSPEPIYQESTRTVSQNPINETHVQLTISANGTLTLTNSTETINTTGTGNLITSLDGTAIGEEVITTQEGDESATAKIFGIARFNMEDGSGRAILLYLFKTNSTGQLAPLDGMILAAQAEIYPDGTTLLTSWEWQSGIPLPTSTSTAMEVPPQMNTTTTNATTTTADANAATTTAAPEEEVVEEQQQQATPTAPSPLFE